MKLCLFKKIIKVLPRRLIIMLTSLYFYLGYLCCTECPLTAATEIKLDYINYSHSLEVNEIVRKLGYI